ncbi:MAG TPA: hypothetical protein VF001_05500 [Candidatus Limnocylindria bacterium]
MRDLRMADDQLAEALTDLGTRIAWPPVPDMRVRVLARISAPRRSEWWRALWSPRYAFAPVLVTIAFVLVAVLVFSPQARATATDILRLRGVEIFRGPVPSATPSPPRSPGSIQTPTPFPAAGLGVLVSLDEAKARAGYAVVMPTDPALGMPDQVYLRATPTSTAVSLVYTQRAGIPTSPQAGVAAIVTEFSGATVDEQFFGKVIDPSTTVETVTINGQPGFWIQGTPHFFFYRPAGNPAAVEQETLRLAGNTLIWTQGGLLLRLEAQVNQATALRIAASVR